MPVRVLLAVLLSAACASASAADTLWLRYYNGLEPNNYKCNRAAAIAVDPARGAVYVCGSGESSYVRQTDMALVCYDFAGNRRWHVSYGGNSSTGSEDDVAHALALDSAGNVYVAGITWNDSPRCADYSYCRYAPDGTRRWARKSMAPDDDIFTDVAFGRFGDLYACGSRIDSASGLSAFLVVRIDPADGDTIWTRAYVLDSTARGRRSRRELHPDFLLWDHIDWDNCAAALAVDPRNGDVVATGWGYTTDDWLYTEWWTMKFDTAGNRLWQVATHGNAPQPEDDDAAFDVAVDDSGNVFACGYSYEGENEWFDFAVEKFSPAGARLHHYALGCMAAGDDDAAFSLCLDDAVPQNLYVTGYVVYPDPLGWDLVTQKFRTTTMERRWGPAGATYNGWGWDAGFSVAWHDGRVYVAGVRGEPDTVPAGSDDILVVCYTDADAPGGRKDTLWTWTHDSPEGLEDFAAAVCVLDTDRIFVAGQCLREDSVGHWTSMAAARLVSPGSGVAGAEACGPARVRVAPNPARGAAWLECPFAAGSVHVTLYDVSGCAVRVLDVGPVSAGRLRLDTRGLAAGVYAVRMTTGAAGGPHWSGRLTVTR